MVVASTFFEACDAAELVNPLENSSVILVSSSPTFLTAKVEDPSDLSGQRYPTVEVASITISVKAIQLPPIAGDSRCCIRRLDSFFRSVLAPTS